MITLFINEIKVPMAKKVIINEAMFERLMIEQTINESGLDKKEISKAVQDAIKNDRDVNKDIEKKVKSLVASAVNTLFRTLWQRRNFYEDEIKR